jgi:hypothetical protein
MKTCVDPIVGDILSSWRYDISGITPEMRTVYERHLAECGSCHSRQRLHRTIDVTLIGLSTISIVAFLLALAVIHHVEPMRNWNIIVHIRQWDIALTLQAAAFGGLVFSLLAWIMVAITTPVPEYLQGVAMAQARVLQSRMPLDPFSDRLQRANRARGVDRKPRPRSAA